MEKVARAHLPPKTVDWFAVIIQLSRHGYTNSLIATSIGVSSSTVGGWRTGNTRPVFEHGDMLLDLFEQVTKLSRESVYTLDR